MRYAKELAFSSPEPFVSLGHVVLTGDEKSIPVQGNLRRSLPGFSFFIALEQKGFLRLVVAFAFRETSTFSLKVRRQ